MTVILEHKPDGESAFTQVASSDPTDPNGNFSFDNVLPTKNTEYRATFAGDHASRLNASTSDSETAEVKVGLTLKVSRTTVKLCHVHHSVAFFSEEGDDLLVNSLVGEQIHFAASCTG